MNEMILLRANLMSSLPAALAALGISLLCGLIVAVVYRLGTEFPSRYMIISALVIPSIVYAVIMVVNGSIGAGIATAGAFSLVRFRSFPGSSRDISMLFLGMASGLITGMGYAGYALLFTVILSLIIIVVEKFFLPQGVCNVRQLKIVIPEDMDYNGAFDDIFSEYVSSCKIRQVKTIRMGTLYELVFAVTLKKGISEKEMLDKIRCRNGNLTVSCGMIPDRTDEI